MEIDMSEIRRLHVKSDWVNGRYITMLKYKDDYIDVGILNPLVVGQITEWCNNAISNAYKCGLEEGVEIAKNAYKQEV